MTGLLEAFCCHGGIAFPAAKQAATATWAHGVTTASTQFMYIWQWTCVIVILLQLQPCLATCCTQCLLVDVMASCSHTQLSKEVNSTADPGAVL